MEFKIAEFSYFDDYRIRITKILIEDEDQEERFIIEDLPFGFVRVVGNAFVNTPFQAYREYLKHTMSQEKKHSQVKINKIMNDIFGGNNDNYKTYK